MFSFLRRVRRSQGITAVGLLPDGFGLVHLERDADGRPCLRIGEFFSCDDPTQLGSALGAVVKEHKLERSRCVCVPWADQYTLRQVDAPNVEPQELRDAARWSVKDLVDFDVEKAVIDFFEIPEPKSSTSPRASRIYVVAAPQHEIDATARAIQSAGLRIKAIDIVELALRNVAALLPHDEHGVGLLFLTPGLGLLTVTRQNLLYLARNIDVELDQLDLKQEFFDDAEGEGDGLASLRREVQRSIDYYERQFGQDPISVLFVAPLVTPVPSLLEYLAEHLSVEVRPLDLNKLVRSEEPLEEALQARCLTAVGGALGEGWA
ncbi:MAG: hypothetical protein V3V67_09695 [Myxococcota bacterium]